MEPEEHLRAEELYRAKEADKRRFLYKDVEEILAHGFLSHTMHLGSNHITLRSSLPDDLYYMNHLMHLPTSIYIRWMIAHHCLMINGYIVSINKQENQAFEIYNKWCKDLPNSVADVLFWNIIGLRNREMRCLQLVQAYCCEDYSRHLWKTYNTDKDWKRCSVIERLWQAYNKSTDQAEAFDLEWEHTKVIAGSMSKKAFDSINNSMKENDRKNRERKQKIIEDAVNAALYGKPEEREKEVLKVKLGDREYDLPVVQGSSSVEDMIQEMKKTMRGEKDYHDLMVEQYDENIRRNRNRMMAERREKLEQAMALREEQEMEGVGISAYTKEQLEEMNIGIKKTSIVTDSMASYLYDRYYKPKIVVGVLGKQGPEQATAANTKKESSQSLQDRISNRNPKLSPGQNK